MEKKKKIIRVTTADISLDLLLKGQLRFLNEHFEVVGLSSDTGLLQGVAKREGIRVIEVPMHREISLGADWKCLWRLRKIFKQERPDIVHSNTPKGSLLAMMAAKMAGVKHRIYLVTGLRYQGASGPLRWILKSMERLSCFCATKVIPEGNGVKQALINDHVTKKPLEVIHYGNINGLDTHYFSREEAAKVLGDRAEMRKRLQLGEDDFVFIFIGRIVGDKGMNELAEVMRDFSKDYRRVKLILVGPFESELDPLKDGNEQFFRESENVRFVGYQADVRPYLLAADALAFPSYREGFPNVVLQAGSMELPSVVTDINGCNEVIENGRNGLIIPTKDAGALKKAMLKIVEQPEKTKDMALQARQVVVERFEQKELWKALLRMYQKTLNVES